MVAARQRFDDALDRAVEQAIQQAETLERDTQAHASSWRQKHTQFVPIWFTKLPKYGAWLRGVFSAACGALARSRTDRLRAARLERAVLRASIAERRDLGDKSGARA